MYTYKASFLRVVDGDTCDLDIDLGLYVHKHERIRIAHIDTPERGQPGWLEAKNERRMTYPTRSEFQDAALTERKE